jgi:hypothetical protein
MPGDTQNAPGDAIVPGGSNRPEIPGEIVRWGDGVYFRPHTPKRYLSVTKGRWVTAREWRLYLTAVGADDPLNPSGSFVYGARRRLPEGDFLKIGSSWTPLIRGGYFGEVVFIERGDSKREAALHRRFAHLRELEKLPDSGEWFRLEGELLEFVMSGEARRRENISRALRNRPKSEEHRRKIAAGVRESWRRRREKMREEARVRSPADS